jgi:hypothetical protein
MKVNEAIGAYGNTLAQHLSKEIGKNQEKFHSSPRRDSNPGPPKSDTEEPITRSRHSTKGRCEGPRKVTAYEACFKVTCVRVKYN